MITGNSIANNFTTTTALPLSVNNSSSSGSSLDRHFIAISIASVVINILVSVVATFLNFLIILTFFGTSSLRVTPSNVLVLGLAIADSGVAIFSQPAFCIFHIADLKQDSILVKSLKTVFVASFSLFGYVSLCTYTLITIDRFLAVYLHLRYNELITTKRYGVALMVIWVSSTLCCLARMLSKKGILLFFDLILPGSMSALNVIFFFKIARVIQRHSMQIQAQQQSVRQSLDMPRYKKSVNTMYYVTGAFLVCYTPFIGVLAAYNAIQDYDYKILFIITQTILMFNGVLNPIIFCIRVEEIRVAIRNLLQKLYNTQE